ncbi:lipopolysaccharide core heptosyltransferase RfaQ [soil metagenome]
MHEGEIDWRDVKRVLIVKLRSIGDTVLATPSLIALKKFAPSVEVDILLEDWVAPLLAGFEYVDSVIPVGKGQYERIRTAWNLRRNRYDIAFNLHGGTTATFFTTASLARHRVGISNYQYSFLYNHLLSSSADFWGRDNTHSAEQQLALLGFCGVPVDDLPKTHLAVIPDATDRVEKLLGSKINDDLALMHPASAFFTKQWPTENYARAAEFLADQGLQTIAVASKTEIAVLKELVAQSRVPVTTFDDLTLPEITALAYRAKLFVGNDSGIAHIAAAVKTPVVVVFGSSNRSHWSPWTDSPSEMVFQEFRCQPCAGFTCAEFGEPRCILGVTPESVFAAISRTLESAAS